jgi:hypothetical protein
MFGTDDIMTFVLPIPPTALIRKKEFPDCPELFVRVARETRRSREVGRLFALLCRLTGLAWLIWAVNSLLFYFVIIVGLYHFGFGKSLADPSFITTIKWQMVVAITLALLFVGKMMFYTSTMVSLQLADRCHECAECKAVRKRTAPNTAAKTGGSRDPVPS